MTNSDCVQGWVEVLHCKYTEEEFPTPSLGICPSNLRTFNESHYTVVGSPLPLCEYYSAFDIYRQFAGTIDSEYGMPRPFRMYDAINLCVNDPKLGKKITTLIFVGKGAHVLMSYRTSRVNFHQDYPLAVVIRAKSFRSMLVSPIKK